MPLSASASGAVSVRGLMTAALTTGLPVGVLYGIAVLWLASPKLMGIDLAQGGSAAFTGFPSPWVTVAGAIGLAVGLSLIVIPLCRALARSARGQLLLAATLLMIAFVLLAPRAGVVPDVASPHAATLASDLRAGSLLANGVLCAGLAVAIPLALRRRLR
ncbi:MAG: hypothetical protein OEY97_10560 [Nitrospirota bacterium]|nr:hypothetical protein [Nitrospirota bacterium]